ncbi:MAG: disulfide bond formation protein B [Hyphomicrobiaceae bacterium]
MPHSSYITRSPAYQAGGFALALALAAILGALFFEYVIKLPPCPLCLQQRWAYYAGIPALFAALVLLSAEHRKAAGLLFFAIAVAFLANAGLGVYHSGVEWKFWPGPDTCSQIPGQLQPIDKSLLKSLADTHVVRCDVAAWRFRPLPGGLERDYVAGHIHSGLAGGICGRRATRNGRIRVIHS